MQFSELELHPTLLKAIEEQGYETPTPIQKQAIPLVLEGKDVMGCAQTGTGKTAAFALPILHLLRNAPRPSGKRPIKALVLAPTRELADQIGHSFTDYGKFSGVKHTVIYGGVGQNPQVDALKRGVDVLIATPGRLLDLMGQGFVNLAEVSFFVLDEADRMLDMGFIPDIRRINRALPTQRQSLLFSATLDATIKNLAEGLLTDPVTVSVAPPATTVSTIKQYVCHVDKFDKFHLLFHLLSQPDMTRVLVFSRTKHGADKIVKRLHQGQVPAEAIHGNKSQNKRQSALDAFKKGRATVLVATDVASRGLDIDEVSHVINFDLPSEAESYVHRIGRTGRAGLSGVAYSFCSLEERESLYAIERLIKQPIEVLRDHPYHLEPPPRLTPLQRRINKHRPVRVRPLGR